MWHILTTTITSSRTFHEKFSLVLLLFANRLRTSGAYVRVAPAHRAYRSYITKMVQNRAFVYALIIVPASTVIVSLPNVDAASAVSIPKTENVRSTAVVTSIGDSSLMLTEEIIFEFDAPQKEKDVSVDVFPQVDTISYWNEEYTTLSIAPKNLWDAGTHYSVALTLGSVSGPATFYNFRADGYPRVKRHIPDISEKNFVVEQGSELNIYFDRPIDDFDFRGISRDGITAQQEVLPESKEVKLTFNEALEEGKEIEFILYSKHKSQSNDQYFPVDTIALSARAPQPLQWPSDSTEREILSIDRTIPKITEGKYIDINLDARLTTLFEDGEAVASYVNSPGASSTPTPVGQYKVENKGLKPLSRSFGVYLPYWLAFTPDGLYGIHDLVEWPPDHPDYPNSPQGGKESIASIDSAVSPGCVRHDSENSLSIYEWAEVGTPIIIY